MNEYLKKIIKAKEARMEEIRTAVEASEDANEVRALTAEMEEVRAARDEAQGMLNNLNSEEPSGGFDPMATYGAQSRSEDPNAGSIDSLEYRTAFMGLVTRGVPIPAELRQDENTLTTDVASVIPTVLVNQIIERMDNCGSIISEVVRTSYKGGVVIPTSNVKPVATWVAEGAGSDRQKKTTGKITFSYFKLRCEISMSMEVGTMALAAFEAKFVENVANAMVIAIEKAILAGDGTTQPKGIITEGVGSYTDHVITTSGDAGAWTYEDICDVEAAVPEEFENSAKWFMTKKDFMDIVKMSDSNGQPIARVNMGIDGKIERTILGRPVVIHAYKTEMGSYIAGVFNFNDYILNTIYDMGIQKKQDWNTEDLLTKAVMSVDGKPVDNYSLILVEKGN